MTNFDLRAHARALLDANQYLTLGTICADGRPWTSPVYFAAAGVREFYWISEIDAEHSRNLVARLYQATAADLWVLCPREPSRPCPLHGLARDHRARVDQTR